MRQTVVGVFDRYASAQRAMQVLADSGFGPDAVHITDDPSDLDAGDRVAQHADDESFTGKVRNFFAGLFGPDEDHEVTQFSETIRRGGALVKVDVDDDAHLDAARQALERAGAMDVDASSARTEVKDNALRTNEEGERAIPVVREELEVGKRAEQTGGVRVFTRSVDKPVRVGEEVVVGKDVKEREERIKDTLHNTEVEVEPLAGGARSDTGWDERRYREHFASQYGASGTERWEDVEPAYRYGSTLASDRRYTGRAWDDIEPDIRRDWETRHPGSAWERFKAAVRHAWETATH